MPDVPTILIAEESKFYASMVSHRIRDELGFDTEWHPTYREAVQAIDDNEGKYLVALLDVHLPGGPGGKIVSYASRRGIPSIILTDELDSEQRRRFIKWNVVDYILRNSGLSLDNLIDTIERIHKNQSVKVLVVDDSKTTRDSLARLLSAQLYQVLEAANGQEALDVLDENPDIKLVVTDYDMPVMDGFDLIRRVREHFSKNKLAIIGMSASGEELLSARLLKTGANDFVPKPFQVEEFHSRVANAVEMIERIELIRDLSYKDSLTRLRNRRYFFENADIFLHRAVQQGLTYSVGMIDIDHFKRVNDTHGHDGGDMVLRRVADITVQAFPDNAIVARFGGEEFCVLVTHPREVDVIELFDLFRRDVEASSVMLGNDEVSVTVSVGVCSEPAELDAMLKLADSRLYTAKETGRNKVVGPPPRPNVRDR